MDIMINDQKDIRLIPEVAVTMLNDSLPGQIWKIIKIYTMKNAVVKIICVSLYILFCTRCSVIQISYVR